MYVPARLITVQPFRNSDKNKLLNSASGNKALGYGTTDTQLSISIFSSLNFFFLPQTKCSQRSSVAAKRREKVLCGGGSEQLLQHAKPSKMKE